MGSDAEMIVNQGTSKEHEVGLIQPHHIRHLISGSIVFLLCICSDVFILHYKHKILQQRPETLMFATATNGVYELKFMSDGTLRWDVKK